MTQITLSLTRRMLITSSTFLSQVRNPGLMDVIHGTYMITWLVGSSVLRWAAGHLLLRFQSTEVPLYVLSN